MRCHEDLQEKAELFNASSMLKQTGIALEKLSLGEEIGTAGSESLAWTASLMEGMGFRPHYAIESNHQVSSTMATTLKPEYYGVLKNPNAIPGSKLSDRAYITLVSPKSKSGLTKSEMREFSEAYKTMANNILLTNFPVGQVK